MAEVLFARGDIGIYEGIWNGPGPWAVTITTSKKRWELRPLEKAAYQLPKERVLHPVAIHPWDEKFKPGFRLQAEMVVKTALGQASESPSLDEALKTMELIHRIYQK